MRQLAYRFPHIADFVANDQAVKEKMAVTELCAKLVALPPGEGKKRKIYRKAGYIKEIERLCIFDNLRFGKCTGLKVTDFAKAIAPNESAKAKEVILTKLLVKNALELGKTFLLDDGAAIGAQEEQLGMDGEVVGAQKEQLG
ncbi:hypothetical protein TIFTF001_026364, partial [Ficus carica]